MNGRQIHSEIRRFRFGLGVLVFPILLMNLWSPSPAAGAVPIDVVMGRAGKGIVATLHRACAILSQIGGQTFSAAVASTAFAPGNRKVRVTITGVILVPGRYVRGRVLASLNQDCPLPSRPECQGLFRLELPANAAQADARTSYRVPFRLDLAVDVEATLKVLTMMGLGFGLKQVDLFPDEAFLRQLNHLPASNLHTVLGRFFPSFVSFLEKRTVSRAVDEILADGRLTGTRALQGLGLDELVGFGINFGLGLAQMAATTWVKEAVALGAGSAALAMPGMAPIAVGAILQVVAVKATGMLIDIGKEQFQAGIYRDRFAKIEAFFMGTWSPGEHHIPWLIDTVTAEAKKDRFDTIQKLILYLRAQAPARRGWWNPLHPKLRAPLAFRAQQEGSWLAERYLAMWDLLFAR
ncbi:MAG: hypothetical protein OZSIB_2847 [Candidatus Ozemobacter sibiricus]|jgi:hypothetical protein|uniref:Uncharacterized protein n=1 Tax=Candidatus Ozemobacter sibiricus TaxID=2268124 RepID=A0A367ZJ78_9BACT|nr:MAG: hypothetical protein OZSIB_2847 [Candidatus Ozemobacter sibiricus]